MAGHDDEIVEVEAVGSDAGGKDVDEEGGVLVGLEERLVQAGFGCDKEGSTGSCDLLGGGVTRWF